VLAATCPLLTTQVLLLLGVGCYGTVLRRCSPWIAYYFSHSQNGTVKSPLTQILYQILFYFMEYKKKQYDFYLRPVSVIEFIQKKKLMKCTRNTCIISSKCSPGTPKFRIIQVQYIYHNILVLVPVPVDSHRYDTIPV
jgi:hypothetical protein